MQQVESRAQVQHPLPDRKYTGHSERAASKAPQNRHELGQGPIRRGTAQTHGQSETQATHKLARKSALFHKTSEQREHTAEDAHRARFLVQSQVQNRGQVQVSVASFATARPRSSQRP